jgi:hypothetical protein
MVRLVAKQLTLKPQDLIVALKIRVNPDREFLLATLAQELEMAVSAVHGSIKRCEQARLLTRVGGGMRAMRPALAEFMIHGARYAFPAVMGGLSRGMATSIAGPSLRSHFDQAGGMPPVWPDVHGNAYGPSLVPLHYTVPAACRMDEKLFDVLSLLDAMRIGAARERELGSAMLEERLA